MITSAVIVTLFVIWLIVRLVRKLSYFPSPPYIGRFLDSDLRRRIQLTDKLIERSGIKKGMEVLEIGCGSGAFTTFVARAVGEQGKVYALDIQPKMLKQLKKKLTKPENRDIKNIKLIESGAYELPFEDNSFDVVFMVTVLQEIRDRNRALEEAKRVLKLGGLLSVTEFLPDPNYAWKATTIKLGTKAGLILDEVSGNLWNYTVRFKKA